MSSNYLMCPTIKIDEAIFPRNKVIKVISMMMKIMILNNNHIVLKNLRWVSKIIIMITNQ